MKSLNNCVQDINTYINIKETAETLSVSPATVRNWIKAGRLLPAPKMGRTFLFNKKDIEALKHHITSGEFRRLRSRRNKRAVSGHFIPMEYVSSESYLDIAESLFTWIDKNSTFDIAPILHEVVLKLLIAKKRLALKSQIKNKSLTEAVRDKELKLGNYEPFLKDLFDPEQPLNNTTIEILRRIHDLDIPFIEGDDLLGLLYMSLSTLSSRKNKGSYYTPSDIVNQLVKQSLQELGEHSILPKVVDPCCGSGNFLIRLFIALKMRLINKGWTVKDAETALLLTCLHGYDIDPIAIKLARLNLILLIETSFEELKASPFLIQCKNTLLNQASIENHHEGFDLVIGNPPWGRSFTHNDVKELKERFNTIRGALESFCLFIEYGVYRLKHNGILSYVLPESLLNVQIHEPTRQLLIDQMQICQIHTLGHCFSKVFAPTILLTARKTKPQKDAQLLVHHEGKKYTIVQRRFIKNHGTIFNVKAPNVDHQIIEHMRTLDGVQFLKEQADFALGIVTGDNKHFLLNEPSPGAESILIGGNIFKYNFQVGERYLVFDSKKFQQAAPEKLYRASEKLFYRFINEDLVFAYDNQGMLSLNSANILIPRLPNVSIKYILAVLNSRPAQFYHQVSFSSVKVLRTHIESIPIPRSTTGEEKNIVHLVDQMLVAKDASERLGLYNKIDDIVMSLYQLKIANMDAINAKIPKVKFLSMSCKK